MEGIELLCFQIISAVGTARSCFIEATEKAKLGEFEEAYKLMDEGDKYFVEGHSVHLQLIQKEASGEDFKVGLILIHAEDQLMSAETFKIVSNNMIELYKEMHELKEKCK